MNNEVDIALVDCFGEMVLGEDEYYDFYDMYAAEYMKILRVLTREEIITYALNLDELFLKRFISLFKLTKEEIIMFKNKYQNSEILDYISYYQENDKEVFKRKRI